MAQLQPGDPWHVGPYEVVARLTTDEGAVSAGLLYLAQYPGAGQVAMRVIAPRLAADDAVRARLSDGVSAARAVTSPTACPLRAAAILRERAPWIAWEFEPGPSLAAVLAGHGRLPGPAVASLAVGLAEALRAIHDTGAVHGDLRPATVFLADGRPRVTGYGVAAAVEAAARAVPGAGPAAWETSPTGPGAGLGAAAGGRVADPRLFIAPELASGEAIGPAGDMFSLGAVVAFAAGGKGPFGIGGPAGSAYHAPYGVPDLGSVPVALRPLITRCLDADPGWRPTAGEFRSLATALLPDAAEPAQWPEVELSDPAPEQGRPALAGPALAAVPKPAPPGLAPSAAAPLPASQVPPAGHSPSAPAAGVAGTRSARPMRPRPMHQARPRPLMTPPGTSSHPKQAIIVACAIIAVIVVAIGLANTGNAPQVPADAQTLYYADYQAGDCLYGIYPNSGGGTWPAMAWQVPCSQSHSDEVFFASDGYWPADATYPGTQAVEDKGYAACESQFTRYVGVLPANSVYNWTYITPHPASEWQAGDRELACIAYKWMPGHSNGVPMKGSIRGSAQ